MAEWVMFGDGKIVRVRDGFKGGQGSKEVGRYKFMHDIPVGLEGQRMPDNSLRELWKTRARQKLSPQFTDKEQEFQDAKANITLRACSAYSHSGRSTSGVYR